MDLQENVREKDEVIQSRNRAFKLIAEELNQNRVSIEEKDALINELKQQQQQQQHDLSAFTKDSVLENGAKYGSGVDNHVVDAWKVKFFSCLLD